MSLLVVRKKSEEKLPLFDYRRLFSSYKLSMRPHVFPQFPKHEIIISPIDYSELFGILKVPATPRRVGLDDSVSRLAIWKALFKDKAFPMIEEGAVEKYAGSLDKYLPENVPLDEITRHAKKG